MTIPPRGQFLLPFLRILSDGQVHKRGEIIERLVQHFGLTLEDQQLKFASGNTVLVNTVAWCDVDFCGAGFALKREPTKDNMNDEFQITPRGLEEFTKNPDKITVGYLQSLSRK